MMQRLLSSFVLALALGVFAPLASAQVGPHHGGHHGAHGPRDGARMAEVLIARLGLDPTQAASVRQIFADARAEHERIHAMPHGSAEQIAARQALMQQTHARIDAVLNDAQRAQLRAERRAGRGHEGGGRGHAAPRTGI